MEVSIVVLFALGFMVGTLVSLDNCAAVAALTSKMGANLSALWGEVTAHIIIVTVGWFAGYVLAKYGFWFGIVAAGALIFLGVWVIKQEFSMSQIVGGLRRLFTGKASISLKGLKSEIDTSKVCQLGGWAKEIKFLTLFFSMNIPLLVIAVVALQAVLPPTSPETGVLFAVCSILATLISLTISARMIGVKWS